MRKLISLLIVLLLQSTAFAELHYFTDLNCGPCKKVSPIVDLMNRQGRDITVHVWQDDEKPFAKYGVDWLPQFVDVEDGKVVKRWVQDAKAGFFFTSSFISGIAPFREKTQKPIPQPADCARPAFPLAVKNLIPPPPAPGLPADIPDRAKVKRIEDLEQLVDRQQQTINTLREDFQKLSREFLAVSTIARGKDGPAGLNGKDGAPGRQGPPGPPGQLDASTRATIQKLINAVSALEALERRFIIADGNEIKADLTYKPGEIVVLDRNIITGDD